MQTAQAVLESIDQNAVTNAKEAREPRFVRTCPVGEVACRQGDIYLWRLPEIPKGCKPRSDRQLALGKTVGSRHVCEAGPKLYDLPAGSANALLGPVIEAPERFTVTHPEHAHISLPSGTYQVGYQLDMRTQRAVAD